MSSLKNSLFEKNPHFRVPSSNCIVKQFFHKELHLSRLLRSLSTYSFSSGGVYSISIIILKICVTLNKDVLQGISNQTCDVSKSIVITNIVRHIKVTNKINVVSFDTKISFISIFLEIAINYCFKMNNSHYLIKLVTSSSTLRLT